MARYRVLVRKIVAKDLRGIPRNDVRRILAAIESLADEPRPSSSKKLSGQDRYRIRQGNYRILYEIEDDRLIICVVKVRHRRSAGKVRYTVGGTQKSQYMGTRHTGAC